MSRRKQVGKNIKGLRRVYGETQEQLGIAINVEKGTISSYETGRTEPSQEVLLMIAKHYMVSIEELVAEDFSCIKEISVDTDYFTKNLEVFFPIAIPEDLMENALFLEVLDKHKELYDAIRKRDDDKIDSLFIKTIETYSEIYERKKMAYEESAANLIGLWILNYMAASSLSLLFENTAIFNLLLEKDEKIRNELKKKEKDLKALNNYYAEHFNIEELDDGLREYFIVLKKSGRWSDLADYYLAAQYIWGLKDNGLGRDWNRRIGQEMIYTYACVGNKYASGLLKIQLGRS